MLKKIYVLLFAAVMFFMFANVFAATEVDDVAQGNCICGRPYYQETTDDHDKFDCINCGKNRTNCTCRCWCGSETIISDEITVNGAPAHLCKTCGQLCVHCTCADREEVLRLEENMREGSVFAGTVAKPKSVITTVIALIFVSACVFIYIFYYVLAKNEQTRLRLKEKNAVLRKHDAILEKINEQANYTAAPSAAKQAAEKALVWNADDMNPATVAFELVNAVHFGTSANSETIPFLKYVSDYITDDRTAEAAALNGDYGKIIQTVQKAQADIEAGKVEQEIVDYFELDFFYNNEKSVNNILGDYSAGGKDDPALAYIPCSNEVRVGGAAATAAHWAEEIKKLRQNMEIRGGRRFAGKYMSGGENSWYTL